MINYWRFEEGSGAFAADEAGLANGTLEFFPDLSVGAGDMTDLGWSTNVPAQTVAQTGTQNLGSIHTAGYGGNVRLSPTGPLNYGSAFTLELFFRLDTLPVLHDPYSFMEFRDFNTVFRLSIWNVAAINLQLLAGGDEAGGGAFFNTPNLPITTGAWYHLTFVKNAGAYQFYLNGIIVDSGSFPSGPFIFDASGDFVIAGSFRGFDGYLDEIRISNVALEPSQFLNVPEPSTFVLTTLALGIVMALRKRCCHEAAD